VARPRRALLALLAAVGVAAIVAWRRRGRRAERVDLYYADGSMVSFHRDSAEAARLLPYAYDILAAARTGA